MTKYIPPLRDRVIAVLRSANQPCTRGQLLNLGCLRYKQGESYNDLQNTLDLLVRDGLVSIVDTKLSKYGPRPGVSYKLIDEVADFRPIRLSNKKSHGTNR